MTSICFAAKRFFQASIILYELTLVYHLHEHCEKLITMEIKDILESMIVVPRGAEENIFETGKHEHLMQLHCSALTHACLLHV